MFSFLKLNEYRDDLEHVKPGGWSLGVGGLPRIAASSAVAFGQLLGAFSQGLEFDQVTEPTASAGIIDRVKAALSKIANYDLHHQH